MSALEDDVQSAVSKARSGAIMRHDDIMPLVKFAEQAGAIANRRVTELLEANNRYLDDARRARAVADMWKNSAMRSISDAGEVRSELADAKFALAAEIARVNNLTDPARGSFTYHEVEAALCVWEWINTVTDPRHKPSAHEAGVAAWRENVGTVEARHASYTLARRCLRIFEAGKAINGEEAWGGWAFDWEVIPAIMRYVSFDNSGYEFFGWTDTEIALNAISDLDAQYAAPAPAAPAAKDTGGRCDICGEPIYPNDICSTDIEMGACHAACLEGSPVVDLETGEPVDGPAHTFRYEECEPNGGWPYQRTFDAIAAATSLTAGGKIENGCAAIAISVKDFAGSFGPMPVLASAPDGWKMMPPAPTDEMKNAVRNIAGAQALAFGLAAYGTFFEYSPPVFESKEFWPTHRHKKRGGEYMVVHEGRLQVDGDLDDERVIIYRGADGKLWVRPSYEFNDGRFEPIRPASENGERP